MFGLSKADFEMSPIVAYGVVLLILILGGLGLERFWASETRLANNLIVTQNEVATLENLSENDQWAERFEKSLQARRSLEQSMWTGITAGVIAAELQQAMRKEALALGYKSLQLRVDTDIQEVEGVDVLLFEFFGQSPDGKNIIAFLESLALMPRLIIIKDAEFSQNIRDRRPPRLTLSAVIPIKIVAAEALNSSQLDNPLAVAQ